MLGEGVGKSPEGRLGDRRLSLHDETVAVVREMILEGVLAPRESIAEPMLCRELGISRTPVREALKVLASEGLVRLLPNRGAMVTEVTVEDVEALFEVMETLERLAGRLAALRATDAEIEDIEGMHARMVAHHREGRRQEYFELNQRIHLRIAECAGNKVLASAYADYLGKIKRARYLANLSQARWDESVREHEEIMAALVARDGEGLGGILQEHLRRTGVIVIQAVKKGGVSSSGEKTA